MNIFWPALGMFLTGLAGFAGFYWAWQYPSNEWLVLTIFPMMGAPYIILGAFVYYGLEGMWDGIRGEQ